MFATYPSTALRSNQAEVKRSAQDQQVIITDSGGRTFQFLTEGAYEASLRQAAEEAAYAERMARAIRRGRAGIARGEFVEGADAAIAAARELRMHRG